MSMIHGKSDKQEKSMKIKTYIENNRCVSCPTCGDPTSHTWDVQGLLLGLLPAGCSHDLCLLLLTGGAV